MQNEQLELSWNKYKKLIDKLDETHPGVSSMVEKYAERIITCPASTDSKHFGAYPGGFMDFSLSVTSKMRDLHRALNLDISADSVLFVGLLHAIGCVGDEENDYFVQQDSKWHLERGSMYKYNENLAKMPVAHRTLYLLQSSGIQLSRDEWVSIAISGGIHREDSKAYIGSEPHLAILTMQARQWVIGRAE